MNQKVREVRKALGLTQEAFAERLGVKAPGISLIENGERALTEQMEKAIVREFGVNPSWFRAGEGEMFINNEDEIDNLIDILMEGESKKAKAVFKALAKKGGDFWDHFADVILEIARELDKLDS